MYVCHMYLIIIIRHIVYYLLPIYKSRTETRPDLGFEQIEFQISVHNNCSVMPFNLLYLKENNMILKMNKIIILC